MEMHRITTTAINDELYHWFWDIARENDRTLGGHLTYLIKAYRASVEQRRRENANRDVHR